MRLSLLGVPAGVLAALLLVLSLGVDTAAAKGPAYLVTGGKLGSHAYLLDGFTSDVDGTDWVANAGRVRVDPPLTVPSLSYDFYSRYGTFAVPYQSNGLGPQIRYYPSLRLVEHVRAQRWYQPPAEAISYLDSTIQDALTLMAQGELENDPFGADLRGRRMHEVNYFLLPYSPGRVTMRAPYGPSALRGECEACLGLIANVEEFVLKHLVDTVSRLRSPDSATQPAYTIEYHGWFGSGGIGGVLGFYSPPADGQAGRFWTGSNAHDQAAPYYETTAGFDAAIEAALAGPEIGTPASLATANDDHIRATVVGAALLAVVLVGGIARRRGSR